jgi:hypothetical protein
VDAEMPVGVEVAYFLHITNCIWNIALLNIIGDIRKNLTFESRFKGGDIQWIQAA